ncbi:DNA-binding response regulator [Lacrimispora indolis]|nr:DNA-binding response regulator [[Clostridium] methoxybenzovorans]
MDCILIVEDDKKISRIIELQLNHAGFETVKAFNGREAIDVFNNTPDIGLVLLDIMLPQLNGYEVLKYIRERSPELPVIFLTAKDDTGDVVNGLNLGADDYITKPFIFDELLARIKANLRKKAAVSPRNSVAFEDLSIDLDTFMVSRGGESIELSKTEFDLLHYLVLNHGLVQSREQILDQVWGFDYFGNDNIVDVYIKYLRDKIDKPFEKKLIQTVRGRGYVIK